MKYEDDKRDDTLAEQCMVNPSEFDYKKYAKLIRADEREACADLCYQLVDNSRETRFATAIRARGNT